MASTNISVEGGRPLAKALGTLAAKKNTTIAKLVREALDEKHGHELEPLISFFADDDTSVNQLSLKRTNSTPPVKHIAAIGGD